MFGENLTWVLRRDLADGEKEWEKVKKRMKRAFELWCKEHPGEGDEDVHVLVGERG